MLVKGGGNISSLVICLGGPLTGLQTWKFCGLQCHLLLKRRLVYHPTGNWSFSWGRSLLATSCTDSGSFLSTIVPVSSPSKCSPWADVHLAQGCCHCWKYFWKSSYGITFSAVVTFLWMSQYPQIFVPLSQTSVLETAKLGWAFYFRIILWKH